MISNKRILWMLVMVSMGAAGCARYDFGAGPAVPGPAILNEVPDLPLEGELLGATPLGSRSMKISSTSVAYDQSASEVNRTVVSFQAKDSNGNVINNVTSDMVRVTENGVEIPGFNFSGSAKEFKPTTDIVFMMDITCSMGPTINSAKSAVINFINNTRANGHHTRMCLSTFGDSTVKACDRFFDNDPAKPETASQVSELITEVTRLQAGCGAADPGGRDLDENPLGNIIDAERAPYAAGSQRFGVLITDAGFLYAGGNAGDLGARAPAYTSALASLQNSGLTLFLAGPSRPGYDRAFSGSPSLVAATGGEYFPYADLVSGRISLDTILGRITLRLQTTYAVEYTADAVPGLNADLPLRQRNIQVEFIDPNTTGTIVLVGTESSAPNGRGARAKSFKLSVKQIKGGSVQVKVNGQIVRSGYQILNGEVVFDQAPAASAKVEVSFEHLKLIDSVQLTPVVLSAQENINLVSVFLNGKKAGKGHIRFERNLNGSWTVVVDDTALVESDIYGVRAKGGLDVQVYRVVAK
jgi:hypothetical protein